MKIGVIGAGALGLIYGGLLSKDNEVILLETNKEAVDLINQEGVNVEFNGITKTYYPKAYLSGTYDKPVDLVFIAVKTLYTKSAIELNKSIISSDTYLLTIQNGLGNREVLEEFQSSDKIILGITRNNCVKTSLNSTKRVNRGLTELGNDGDEREFVDNLKRVLTSSGLETITTPVIEVEIWKKLFVNMTLNPITVLFDCIIGDCYFKPDQNALVRKCLKEAVEVANASGMSFDYDEIYNTNLHFCETAYEGHPSMWQDFKAKRLTEIDFMNGAVSKIGSKLGVETPTNDYITKAIHDIESKY